MKKALYVATVDIHIRLFHLPYLKLLHDKGYEVHVATNGDEKFPFCDVKHQICIERSPFKLSNFKAIKQLKKIIDNEKFDIIHCHTPMGAVVTRLAAKKARNKYGTRVIYTAHGFHFYKGAPLLNWLLFYPIEKWLSKYTDTIITINKEDYNIARKSFKSCNNIEYIPGVGIEKEKFDLKLSSKEFSRIRSSLGLKDTDFLLIFPARLDKNKNQLFLINVMEKLVSIYNNIHLILPGSDELNGFYQRIVLEKKLGKNIHFLGYRSDIPQLMNISNVAVSSSLREGLPVNVIEAFACKLPVVATDCRGMKDLIKNGKNGFLILNNNVDDFTNKIVKIYNGEISFDKENFSVEIYTVENILKELKRIYKL